MGLCSAPGCSPRKSQLDESQLVPHSCCSPSSHCTPRSPHSVLLLAPSHPLAPGQDPQRLQSPKVSP